MKKYILSKLSNLLPFVAFILLLGILCFLDTQTDHLNKTSPSYISRQLGIDLRNYDVITTYDSTGGNLGYMNSCTSFQIENDSFESELIHDSNKWAPLPMNTDIRTLLYGGTKNGIYYNCELLTRAGVPYIEHGYYYFVSRDSQSTSPLEPLSYDLYVAVYDSDTRILYYYESEN